MAGLREDACYYVTARKLAGSDPVKAAAASRLKQRRRGAPVVEIQSLFHAAGLPSRVTTFTDLNDVTAAVVAAGTHGGPITRCGLAFARPDGTGHMVVAAYVSMTDSVRFDDYQLDDSGADATDDLRTATHYFLFE